MSLLKGKLNVTYTIHEINTSAVDIKDFLFSLGCYPGEEITIISKLASNFIINIKDARYSIDESLANVIVV